MVDTHTVYETITPSELSLLEGVMSTANEVADHTLTHTSSIVGLLAASRAYAENASEFHVARAARAKGEATPPSCWPYNNESWQSSEGSSDGDRLQDVTIAIGFLLATVVAVKRKSHDVSYRQAAQTLLELMETSK